MESTSKVTLQINLAPSDFPHAKYILPHQLKQFGNQVDEILLILDLHRSAGKFSEGWEQGLPKVRNLINDICLHYPNAHLLEVDYSPESKLKVSNMFFNGKSIPPKDFRGGPFYSYFFGLYSAKYNYVFHLDSDLMFGGGSNTWIDEAVALLTDHSDILVCAPLPGPPTNNSTLRSQSAQPEPHYSTAFRFNFLSTRLFMLDRERFISQIKYLPLKYAPIYGIFKALIEGNYPYRLPEEILTEAMIEKSLQRVDFLGKSPGMWSLHPPYRSKTFYDLLPQIIEKIELGEMPNSQLGDHDINDSLIDWSSARASLKQNRWWKRLIKQLSQKI
ncbi:hypothetical protein HCU40_01900 [Pseudanabaena biceps]|nr:hypothetical protein [Pseudanabaena biceps]